MDTPLQSQPKAARKPRVLVGWMLIADGHSAWRYRLPDDDRLLRAVVAELIDTGRGFVLQPDWEP